MNGPNIFKMLLVDFVVIVVNFLVHCFTAYLNKVKIERLLIVEICVTKLYKEISSIDVNIFVQ